MVPELNAIAGYKERFQKVFRTDVTKEGIAKAIAAFERTVLSGNSPYDKFKAGDETALTDVQKRGMELFDDVGCSTCHAPPMFSNYRYYNAGVGRDKEKPDEGRKAVTGEDKRPGQVPRALPARSGQHGTLLPRRQLRHAGESRGPDGRRRNRQPEPVGGPQRDRSQERLRRGSGGHRRVPEGALRRVPGRRAAHAAVKGDLNVALAEPVLASTALVGRHNTRVHWIVQCTLPAVLTGQAIFGSHWSAPLPVAAGSRGPSRRSRALVTPLRRSFSRSRDVS